MSEEVETYTEYRLCLRVASAAVDCGDTRLGEVFSPAKRKHKRARLDRRG